MQFNEHIPQPQDSLVQLQSPRVMYIHSESKHAESWLQLYMKGSMCL
jgi:hypothetical protein